MTPAFQAQEPPTNPGRFSLDTTSVACATPAPTAARTLAGRPTQPGAGPSLAAQAALFDTWRHHAFITDTTGTAIDADQHHRKHAVVELAIRDLKDGAGLNHCPSGNFDANAAWTVFATIAHNLMRWAINLGTGQHGPWVAKTMRRLFAVAGRITTSGRTRTLHLPTQWPWTEQFTDTLTTLRALPAPSG